MSAHASSAPPPEHPADPANKAQQLDDLRVALQALSSERLQRLVDRLESDPEIKVTVGAWRPQCPMVLAGFDPARADTSPAECVFAAAWDRFAASRARWWMHLAPRGFQAHRREVQILLRTANEALAARTADRAGSRAHSDGGCR